MTTKTKYKIQTFWQIDTPMASRKEALSEIKKRIRDGNKNIIKINVVENRGGAEIVIKTFEKEVSGKTEIVKL